MKTTLEITWLKAHEGFAGEIGASLALSRKRWQALGADFEAIEDGSGERPCLAVASIENAQGETRFGVLDYGEDITYLLVPSVERRDALTASALSALQAVGWIVEEEVVDDSRRRDEEVSLAKPVEGSGGLLLEIDGKIVPNYAATMVSFEEGDVVKGKGVRIDKDEVLVDIGYKSEGVIPSHELSTRESGNPAVEDEGVGLKVESMTREAAVILKDLYRPVAELDHAPAPLRGMREVILSNSYKEAARRYLIEMEAGGIAAKEIEQRMLQETSFRLVRLSGAFGVLPEDAALKATNPRQARICEQALLLARREEIDGFTFSDPASGQPRMFILKAAFDEAVKVVNCHMFVPAHLLSDGLERPFGRGR
jgi:S1 RNA binding domain